MIRRAIEIAKERYERRKAAYRERDESPGPTHADIARMVSDFLRRGGQIQRVPPGYADGTAQTVEERRHAWGRGEKVWIRSSGKDELWREGWRC